MRCLECGNCKEDVAIYYCTAKNEFVVKENPAQVVEKDRSGWKEGDPGYESHRRRNRKEEVRKIG